MRVVWRGCGHSCGTRGARLRHCDTAALRHCCTAALPHCRTAALRWQEIRAAVAAASRAAPPQRRQQAGQLHRSEGSKQGSSKQGNSNAAKAASSVTALTAAAAASRAAPLQRQQQLEAGQLHRSGCSKCLLLPQLLPQLLLAAAARLAAPRRGRDAAAVTVAASRDRSRGPGVPGLPRACPGAPLHWRTCIAAVDRVGARARAAVTVGGDEILSLGK